MKHEAVRYAQNETETAQKLTNAEKTINTLIEKNKELEMGLKINQEDFSLLLRQNRELEKKLQVQESNKKTLLIKYEAPKDANFWTFIQEKFMQFTQKIKELTQKIKELTEKIFNVEEKNQQLLKENLTLQSDNELLKAQIQVLQAPLSIEERAEKLIEEYQIQGAISVDKVSKIVRLSLEQERPAYFLHKALVEGITNALEKKQKQEQEQYQGYSR